MNNLGMDVDGRRHKQTGRHVDYLELAVHKLDAAVGVVELEAYGLMSMYIQRVII